MTNIPDRSRLATGWPSAGVRGPGSRRLALGGFILALQGLATARSLLLFALQGTNGALQLFGFSSPPLLVYLVEVPIAVISIVGGASLWQGWWVRIGLLAVLASLVLGVGIGIAGGGFELLVWEVALFVLVASGAGARRAALDRRI